MSQTLTQSIRGAVRRGRGRGRGGAATSRPATFQATTNTTTDTPLLTPSQPTPAASGTTTPKLSHLSQVRFADINGLEKALVDAVPFEYCTEVQAKTLEPILSGSDVLAQAKTGTGKTLAFLIPSIQNLLLSTTLPPQGNTSILVLSPTRELAIQISDAAKSIVEKLKVGEVGVQVVVGGTNISSDVSRMKKGRADILIATPGRLVDLLENYGLSARLSQLRCLVLDEADRLLDQGFRNELMKIINSLPDRKAVPRQTLLFSATIPQSVHQIASLALLPTHKFISTLTAEDLNTHERVDQFFAVVPIGDLIAKSVQVLLNEYEKEGDEFKVMCFLPTARAAGLYYDIFQNLKLARPLPTWEIHSRMSQSKRMKVTEEFRVAKTGVLFSSDVVARGIDIPGVSMVMQVGLPANGEQYVHRLGRTARAGAKGQGILLLADFELPFLRTPDMRPLPLKPLATSSNDASALAQCHQILRAALLQVGDDIKAQAYQAFLGYYKGSMRLCGFDTTTLIQTANYYAQHVLLYQGGGDNVETPPLLAKTVGMMGLKGAPGLNIVKALPGKETGGGGGRGNGRGSTARGGAGGGRSQQGPGSRANGHIVPGSGMDGQQQQQRTTGPTRGGGGRGRGGARRGGPPS